MSGPFHRNCNCRCQPPFPCIEACSKSGDFDYTNVRVNMTAPTWPYYTDTASGTSGPTNYAASVFVPTVGAIATTQLMRRRPDGSAYGYGQKNSAGVCQWLWNDVNAVPAKWLSSQAFYTCAGSPVNGSYSTGTPYAPVNGADATSPWDRELIVNPDYDCDTCYCAGCGGTYRSNPRQRYHCGNALYFTAGVLYIIEGGAPNPPTTYYEPVGSGHWYWVFEWQAFTALMWATNSTDTFYHGAGGAAGTLVNTPGLPQPLDYIHPPIAIPVGGMTTPYGGELINYQYAKEIDCDTDFEGSPITLNYNRKITSGIDLTTYPTTVTIELLT